MKKKSPSRVVHCPGIVRNGPDKAYSRCPICGKVDYELYEGDRCRNMIANHVLIKK